MSSSRRGSVATSYARIPEIVKANVLVLIRVLALGVKCTRRGAVVKRAFSSLNAITASLPIGNTLGPPFVVTKRFVIGLDTRV